MASLFEGARPSLSDRPKFWSNLGLLNSRLRTAGSLSPTELAERTTGSTRRGVRMRQLAFTSPSRAGGELGVLGNLGTRRY